MNKNSTFIVIRHGKYDSEHNLSPEGEEQIYQLSQEIKKAVNGQPIKLLCSTAPRASQGGGILIRELEIPAELAIFEDCLWDDNTHYSDWDEVEKILKNSFEEDTVVLIMSHFDLVPDITSFVANEFGHDKKFGTSNYAKGWLVNNEGFHSFPD